MAAAIEMLGQMIHPVATAATEAHLYIIIVFFEDQAHFYPMQGEGIIHDVMTIPRPGLIRLPIFSGEIGITELSFAVQPDMIEAHAHHLGIGIAAIFEKMDTHLFQVDLGQQPGGQGQAAGGGIVVAEAAGIRCHAAIKTEGRLVTDAAMISAVAAASDSTRAKSPWKALLM